MRLWVDRAFTIRGSGTVVTGTLGAGRLRVGDELELAATGASRSGCAACSASASRAAGVAAVARVAVNLRGVPRDAARPRATPCSPPARGRRTDLLDVRLAGDPAARPAAPR